MSTSGMLIDELTKIKLLAMDDPMIWINLVHGSVVFTSDASGVSHRIILGT